MSTTIDNDDTTNDGNTATADIVTDGAVNSIPNTETATAAIELNTMVLYQNSTTGQVSATPISVQQFGKLLLLPSIPHIHANTNVLVQNSWMAAKNVPILREICALWYVCHPTPPQKNEDVVDALEPNRVKGPFPTNQLAKSLHDHVLVSSAECTNSKWSNVKDVPNLEKALHVFTQHQQQQSSNHDSSSKRANRGSSNAADDDLKELLDDDENDATNAPAGRKRDREESQHDDEESYVSDGGTMYIKDPKSDSWLHEAMYRLRHGGDTATSDANRESATNSSNDAANDKKAKKKQKKAQFAARNARCWIYVDGLPLDTSVPELQSVFGKAGLLDLDPQSQRSKIKLYRTNTAGVKGDASLCYARPESVDLAMTLFDQTPLRMDGRQRMTVSRAKFQQHGATFEKSNGTVSNAQRKVAKLATQQAVDWDAGTFNGRLTGGRKGLRIIVLNHMFQPGGDEDAIVGHLESSVRTQCETWGDVEKITIFSKHPDGILIVKFTQPGAAGAAVTYYSGRSSGSKSAIIEASFWDGVTDYSSTKSAVAVAQEKVETKQRENEFGNWLNEQELPEELKLQSQQQG